MPVSHFIQPSEETLPQRDVLRLLFVHWWPVLSDAEKIVSVFIYMRTFFYNKTSESILFSHFLTGIEDIAPGLGWTPRHLRRVLTGMRNKGLLQTFARPGHNPTYALATLPPDKNVLPPRTNMSGEGCLTKTMTPDINVPRNTLSNIGYKAMKLTSGSVSSPLVRRLEDAAGKHSVARQRKLAKRSASSYPLLWGEFCRDSWQGKEYGKTWTRKDLAIFRRSLESYPSLDVRNYLQVCVENWKEIAQQCFAWLKDTTIPPFPQPGFFTRHHKTFLNAYLRYRDNGVFIIASRKLAEKKEVNTELADLRAENAKLKAAVSRQSSTVNAVRHPPEKKIKIKIKSGMAKRVGLTEWE